MVNEIVLNRLQKRNTSLKSELLHQQFKLGNYSGNYFKNKMLEVLYEYKLHKSLLKAASNADVDEKLALKWYVLGQKGDPNFRGFYLAIADINNNVEEFDVAEDSEGGSVSGCNNSIEGEYKISPYGDGWSYTTYVGGEKIFLISNDLDSLKSKVKSKNFPLD